MITPPVYIHHEFQQGTGELRGWKFKEITHMYQR